MSRLADSNARVGLGDLTRIEDEPWVAGAPDRASAPDVAEHLPDGLRTLLGREYGDSVEPSTGQWQKVALGRSMMREDPLLLILTSPRRAWTPIPSTPSSSDTPANPSALGAGWARSRS